MRGKTSRVHWARAPDEARLRKWSCADADEWRSPQKEAKKTSGWNQCGGHLQCSWATNTYLWRTRQRENRVPSRDSAGMNSKRTVTDIGEVGGT